MFAITGSKLVIQSLAVSEHTRTLPRNRWSTWHGMCEIYWTEFWM